MNVMNYGKCGDLWVKWEYSKNVYFEVGIARGCGKVVIQTALFGTDLEFDVRNWRTLFYKNATELEKKLISSIPDVYKEVMEKKDEI